MMTGSGSGSVNDLERALHLLEAFASSSVLTARIGGLETSLQQKTGAEVATLLTNEGIDKELLSSALAVKKVAGQINVIVHALGILVSLPHVLEPGEVVEGLSLGAGNTGRSHDLETDRRIAEFKFIDWKGGAESIRQNTLFADLFNLASAETDKRRVLYVVGKEQPLRFLSNRRALSSVLSKNSALESRFRALHGQHFAVVSEYFLHVREIVELVDLRDVVPAFAVPR